MSIVDTSISFAVNFNYQVFSTCEKPNSPSTSTPTFDSELGVEIDTYVYCNCHPRDPGALFLFNAMVKDRRN